MILNFGQEWLLLETYWSVIKAHKIFLIMSIWTINSCIAYLFWSNTNPLILFISGWTIEPSFPTQCWGTFWKQIVQRFRWLIIMKVVRLFQKLLLSFQTSSFFVPFMSWNYIFSHYLYCHWFQIIIEQTPKTPH